MHISEKCAVRYQSGQMDQTVNLAAQAFEGSNPSLTTIPNASDRTAIQMPLIEGHFFWHFCTSVLLYIANYIIIVSNTRK